MDSLEYKTLVNGFLKNLAELAEDLQLVEDGDIAGEKAAALIGKAKEKLAGHTAISTKLAATPTLLASFTKSAQNDISSIASSLANIEAAQNND